MEKEKLEQEEMDQMEDILEEPAPEESPEEGQESESSEQELLQKKYDDLNDKYLRLLAEYDNYRKRSQREKDEIYPAATAAALGKLLPILDNLERAAEFQRDTEEFAKGFEMILQSFKEVMEGFGVESIGEVGEAFDPNLHNAVMHIEDENFGENVVSQVLQKGYKVGDRVIRYAMVQTAN